MPAPVTPDPAILLTGSRPHAIGAALLSLALLGLGQVLARAWPRAWCWYLPSTVTLTIATYFAPSIAPTPAGLLVIFGGLLFGLLVFSLVSAIDAYRLIHRRPLRPRGAWYRSTWVALAVFVTISTALQLPRDSRLSIRAFNIPSGPNIPTLMVGDYLMADTSLAGQLPARGDMTVFLFPRNNRTAYVMRVVGLPGDRVQMRRGILHLNGVAVPRELDPEQPSAESRFPLRYYRETLPGGRSYRIAEHSDTEPLDNTREFLVPADHVFVLGDSRDNSLDSRVPEAVGFVPVRNIIGRAATIYWAQDRHRILTVIE